MSLDRSLDNVSLLAAATVPELPIEIVDSSYIPLP